MKKNDLQEVYRKRVLEHSRNPHNFASVNNADLTAKGFNPLCGDKITVYVTMNLNQITSINFQGSGCAISIASASMMTDAINGHSLEKAQQLILNFRSLFNTTKMNLDVKLNEAKTLEGVKNYPSRIKCATLPWLTLQEALEGKDNQVSTE